MCSRELPRWTRLAQINRESPPSALTSPLAPRPSSATALQAEAPPSASAPPALHSERTRHSAATSEAATSSHLVLEGEEGGEGEAPVATEAEGLRLHLSRRASTGYKGVCLQKGRFRASCTRDGRSLFLGYFDSAVEAAVAYALAVGEAAAEEGDEEEGGEGEQESEGPVTEAEGLRLHLSSRSSSGYKGVRQATNSDRFEARYTNSGTRSTNRYLGNFDSAVEAAVAYARAIGEAEDDDEEDEGGEEESEEEEEEGDDPAASWAPKPGSLRYDVLTVLRFTRPRPLSPHAG